MRVAGGVHVPFTSRYPGGHVRPDARTGPSMIGVILAAGIGSRLRPLTERLPKALLSVGQGDTLLDCALSMLGRAGVERTVVVTGFAAGEIEDRLEDLEHRHAMAIATVFNPGWARRNNAYSLWIARRELRDGAILVNADTLFPVSVLDELGALPELDYDIALAADMDKSLGAEEMKLHVDPRGYVTDVSKDLDPVLADGEYIGVARIAAGAAERLEDALAATWRDRPDAYYEDGFQRLIDQGGRVLSVPFRRMPWVEVDDHADLALARTLHCRS